jgi:hypothetical protein
VPVDSVGVAARATSGTKTAKVLKSAKSGLISDAAILRPWHGEFKLKPGEIERLAPRVNTGFVTPFRQGRAG